MIHTVIFDMDGVLINSEAEYFRRQMHQAARLGLEPTTRVLQDYIGKSDTVTWAQAIPNPDLVPEAIADYERGLEAEPFDYPRLLNPGALALVKALKAHNYQVGLASAAPLPGVQLMLETTGLAPYFDRVISGTTLKANKPDPEIYLQSLKQLGARASESIAIEDSPTGILAAHRAGMQAWAVAPQGYTLDQHTADRIAPDLATIQTWLMEATQ